MNILEKILGKQKPVEKEVQVLVEEKQVNSEQSLIDEIHNEFDTAPQRILEQALAIIDRESNSKIVLESNIEEKANRLEKLGFNKNGLVAKKQDIDKRNSQKDAVIEMEVKQANLINYYSRTYPFLKFLPESELDRICEKYGLVYAPVKHYKMPVPEKNLEEIENSQPTKAEDKSDKKVTWKFIHNTSYKHELYDEIIKSLGGNEFTDEEIVFLYKKHFNKVISKTDDYNQSNLIWKFAHSIGKTLVCDGEKTEQDRSGLFIAAPQQHFDLEGLEFDKNKGYFKVTKTLIKDPIVFKYVKGGILVVTKWGLEGEDPALQMEILN